MRAVEREEAGAAGAAMIAALRLGLYPDAHAVAAAWVDPLLGPGEAPDPALQARYDELFAIYRATREALAPSRAALAPHRRAWP